MKRVKSSKRTHIERSLLAIGLLAASAGVQASVTISARDWRVPGGVVALSILPAILQTTPAASAPINHAAGKGVQTSVMISARDGRLPRKAMASSVSPALLGDPAASAAVNGSMYYSGATGYGSFDEYDSSADGASVVLGFNRKGFGYEAEAMADSGLAAARAETVFSTDLYGSSSAFASTSWNDWFVISGGSGLGTASFSALLDGMMRSSKFGSAAYSLSIGYSTDTFCYGWHSPCSEADVNQTLVGLSSSLSGSSSMMLSQGIKGDFTFAYGKPFQLTATLQVNASNGGAADLTLVSLRDSVVLPQGMTLVNASGFYAQAVPEAETYAMMLAGLGLVGWAVRRRRMN